MANFNHTKIVKGKEARDLLAMGINEVADFIKTTIGANGRTNIIRKENGQIVITKDGVSCSRVVICDNEVSDIGGKVVKQACEQTLNDSGDATTTAAILTQAISIAGMNAIDNGDNPVELIKGINMAKDIVIKKLNEMTEHIGYDSPKLKQVAIVASNNDIATGTVIHEAVVKAGKYGLITVMENKEPGMSVETSDGYEINSGYEHPYFINNNSKLTCEYEDCAVVVVDKHFRKALEVSNMFDKLSSLNKPIVFICIDIEGDALATIVRSLRRSFNPSKMKDGIEVLFIDCPVIGVNRTSYLEDLCIYTGAKFIATESGMDIDRIEPEKLLECVGYCDKVIAWQNHSVIFGGKGKADTIKERVDALKKYVDDGNDDEFIKRRIQRLTCSATLIKVGGRTGIALNELKDRIDDSVHATMNAAKYGIVIGGGCSYLNCIGMIEDIIEPEQGRLQGMYIVKKSLMGCFGNILKNAGYDDDFIMKKIKAIVNSDYGTGFNVLSGQIENIIESGIVNAVKSEICALENAVSASTTLLLSSNILYPVFK